MTSQRPFLPLRISFPGRPIFIQFVPGRRLLGTIIASKCAGVPPRSVHFTGRNLFGLVGRIWLLLDSFARRWMRLVSFERLGFGAGLRPSFCLRLGSGCGSLSIWDILDILDLLDLLDLFLGFWLVVVVRVYQHCFGLGPRCLRPLLQLLPLTEIPAAAAAADTFLDGGVVLSRVLRERDVVCADDVSLDLVPLAEDDFLADLEAIV